jgi:hypothetical protein
MKQIDHHLLFLLFFSGLFSSEGFEMPQVTFPSVMSSIQFSVNYYHHPTTTALVHAAS